MANLKDVAKRAKVSIATVSNVLNNTKYVSDDIKQRVYKAIEETGYIQNNIARSLKTQQTKTIGIVVTYIENPVYSGLFREIESQARSKGYSVIVCNSNDDPEMEKVQVELLLSNRVDGLIVVPSKNSKISKMNLLPTDFPIVFINRKISDFDFVNVVIENKKAAYEAVEHLIQKHHLERIAMVIGEKTNQMSQERKEGYITALNNNGLKFQSDLLVDGYSTFQGGVSAAKSLFSLEQPPDGIFVAGTTMMLGVLFQIKKMGIRCPEDVAIIGFSDSNINLLMDPPLSSVVQPIQDLARNGLTYLLRQIEKQSFKKETVVLPCSINYRRSCGCEWEPTIEMIKNQDSVFENLSLF